MQTIEIRTACLHLLLFSVIVLSAWGCSNSEQNNSAGTAQDNSASTKQSLATPVKPTTPTEPGTANLHPQNVLPIRVTPLDMHIAQPVFYEPLSSHSSLTQLPPTPAQRAQKNPSEIALEHNLLPNLFEEQNKNASVELGGRLITDDKIENFVKSVEGVEVSIDIPIP